MKFFELDEDDPGHQETRKIFLGPVTLLVQLRDLGLKPLNIYRSLQFPSKVGKDFRNLLFKKDDKALWLFGYWFGLLSRFGDIWWCKECAWRDYCAVCTVLRDFRSNLSIEGKWGDLWGEMMIELESLVCSQDSLK